jgi:hypothetical protein
MIDRQSLWDEFIVSHKSNLEKLFASNVWKKSLLPWMKAHRANRAETIIHSKDHISDDINKGMAIALEMLINLPEAIAAYEKQKPQENPEPQPATDYSEGLAWDEDDER